MPIMYVIHIYILNIIYTILSIQHVFTFRYFEPMFSKQAPQKILTFQGRRQEKLANLKKPGIFQDTHTRKTLKDDCCGSAHQCRLVFLLIQTGTN